MPGVLLAEFKDALNITGATADAELGLHLAAALEVVEEDCGPVTVRDYTEVVSTATGMVLVRRYPVVSVTRAVTPDPSRDRFDVGRIDLGGPVYQHRLEYTAGRPDVPASLRLAVYVIGAHLWETQRGQMVRPGIGSDSGGSSVPMGFAIPNRAAELMRPHQQRTNTPSRYVGSK